jgi:hypothetical protein
MWAPGQWIDGFLATTGGSRFLQRWNGLFGATMLHRNPADRFLVAPAMLTDLALITPDQDSRLCSNRHSARHCLSIRVLLKA